MTLKERISEDMKAAMRAKDAARLSAVRLLLAAMKQKEVDERVELADADVLGIIEKMVKQRRESIAQYEKAARQDLADQEKFEIGVLQAYLPQQEIKDGVVEIAIIEARIGKVTLNLKEGTRYSENLVRGIVEKHLVEGTIITETGLETPLLLLNDLPGLSARAVLEPGKQFGTTDVAIRVEEKAASAMLRPNNNGRKEIGQWRAL